MSKQETTLIVGGTGKTGRRVAARLKAQGLPVRVASRGGTPPFDWEDPSTWTAVLAGVRSLYLAYHPDLAVPGAAAHIRLFTRLAVDSGVERVVLLSGRGESQVLPSEQAVRECGAAFTILRASWFSQNFSEGHLADAVRSGELAFPAGDVGEPFIDADDIADVAVAALGDDAHAGQVYELTGPSLVTFAEAMAIIGRASGRAVTYRPVSGAEYAELLAPYVPAEQVAFLVELFGHVLDGHNAHVSDDVERVLGRPARAFEDFARAAAAAGAWAV